MCLLTSKRSISGLEDMSGRWVGDAQNMAKNKIFITSEIQWIM
jgi:hypothetical protein